MSASHGLPDSLSSFSNYMYPTNLSSQTDQYAIEKSPRGVSTAPESNNRAVISALLGLQEKIRRLEVERSEAEGNLNSLANETAHYRDLIKRQHPVKQASQMPSLKHSQDLRDQLASAESRSHLLEEQLEHMRNLVHSDEHERDSAERQQELQGMQQRQIASDQIMAQKMKLGELEKENSELKATQALAESKIEDLESKVKEEKHQREKLQCRADSLQTIIKTTKILNPTSPTHKVKRTKKKRKTQTTGTKVSSELPHCYKQPCTPTRHLRLRMDNVPFVAGKSTTPSHNVNVNMQNVIALMKTHNSAWCGNAAPRNQPHGKKTKTRKSSLSLSSTASSDSDLADLLFGLQDEFGQLAFKHQEITKQIQETTQQRLQEDLEQELALLLKRMEAKGDQINKLKKHKEKIAKKTMSNMGGKAQSSVNPPHSEAEVKVITTVKTRGKGFLSTKVITPDSKTSPLMLHKLKTLQTTLRKDDVSWD